MSTNIGTEHEISPTAMSDNQELLRRFKAAKVKVAIQKDGTLTDISRDIVYENYGVRVSAKPRGNIPVEVSDDGEYGFVFARNKAICNLVVNGAVDRAIVGTDRLIEDRAEDKVVIVASYEERGAWPITLATPIDVTIDSPTDISRVATQYPAITRRFFEAMGNPGVEIITTVGGTELYPYLSYGEEPIDAVVDLVASGATLAAHNLRPWLPTLGRVYPVLIQRLY